MAAAVKAARDAAPGLGPHPGRRPAPPPCTPAANAVEAATRRARRASCRAEMGKPVGGAADSIAAGRRHAAPVRRTRPHPPRPGAGRRRRGHRPDGVRPARRGRGDHPVERPGRGRPAACSAPRWSPATRSCHKPSERTPATGWRLAQLLAPHFPDGVFSLLSGDGAVGAALAAADGGRGRPRRLHRDRPVDRGGVRAHRRQGAAGERRQRPADRRRGRRPGLGGAAGGAGRVRQLGPDLRLGRADLRPPRRRRRRSSTRWPPRRDTLGRPSIGPLVDRRLRDAVARPGRGGAVEDGARALRGGAVPDGPGAYYPPTVLADCTDDMAVMREETFGPVAPVVTVGLVRRGADPGRRLAVRAGGDRADRLDEPRPAGLARAAGRHRQGQRGVRRRAGRCRAPAPGQRPGLRVRPGAARRDDRRRRPSTSRPRRPAGERQRERDQRLDLRRAAAGAGAAPRAAAGARPPRPRRSCRHADGGRPRHHRGRAAQHRGEQAVAGLAGGGGRRVSRPAGSGRWRTVSSGV